MSASMTDSGQYMIFQTVMFPKKERRNRQEFIVLEGDHRDGPAEVSFEVRMKGSFVKKSPLDLVKNDRVILQKQRETMFFLIQAPKSEFQTLPDGGRSYVEEKKTSQYSYRISITMHKAKEKDKPEISPKEMILNGDVTAGVNAMLREYGISDRAENVSVASEYMKKWQLEHPEENWIDRD